MEHVAGIVTKGDVQEWLTTFQGTGGTVRDRKGCVGELKTNQHCVRSLLYVHSQDSIYFDFQIT